MITAEMPVKFDRKKHKDETLLTLYRNILKPRMIEEKMLILLRQGKISKWFSGIGQEAISVGLATALEKEEFILPMHRNLGVFTTRGIPLNRLFSQFTGKPGGFTKGRDRSFHFGTQEYKIVGMISHLGPQMGVADGISLANKLRKDKRATAVFTGDGATSEGDFHESMNVAAVWDLPVIFVIENNGYGLSTPSSEQFKCKQFIDKAIGYGIEGVQVDGNNVLKVYEAVKKIAEDIREKPRPVLLECITFRMRGHEEASGTKYIPKELFDIWGKKDPVQNFERYLLEEGVLTEDLIEKIRAEFKKEIETGLDITFNEQLPEADTAVELKDMYKPYVASDTKPQGGSPKRMIDAISDGMRLAMKKHPNLVLMGQDIAEYGGAFKITDGFVAEFGKDRVRNTPLCESAILGTGFGLSINGYKSMVEMQFADFVSEGMTQIINNLAKSHYRWGQHADVVVRMPTGAGVAAGPFHSQSNEAWFFKTPGLKIAYPAFPSDAKGLLLSAFEDPNPVMFFEHKGLYRSITEDVPDDYYTLPFGKARLVKEGTQVSIVTYGMGVHWAIELLEQHPEISADLIDLRTLAPLDTETIYTSVKKTGRAFILHEDTITGGIGGELSALIAEHCFEYLDAPIAREGSLDTPVPMNADLEINFLPKERFKNKLLDLLEY
ncbi:MAG: pyruvate/2-oxoglutarate dehydrogenase complex, dehydrogenase component beta subunit [Bacteroidetes bacterium]|jgi:2-oxoisovalerate dehydrogenase E1 component|nr:pyruvate/2-oxoglutarate dehydrogenase complex, dehydrogenase component beta subunit [Bacteroidota bacterium]